MRNDLRELRLDDEVIAELRMLTAHRGDLAAERTRNINRLRQRLLGVFPALERALDFTNQGPLVLVSQVQTLAAIRSTSVKELASWLRSRKVRASGKVAAAAVHASALQRTRIRGETVAATLVADLAVHVLEFDRQLAVLDKRISERFHTHRHAPIITSMVGVGDLLGAEFLTATGGSMTAFASADHLAGYAGLAPTPRDSGRRTGNLHRPRRYNRQLQRVFYTSAMISIQRSPASRAFYDRKRAEGKRHSQAILALARRRVDVMWAMLRDERSREERAPRLAAAA